MKILVMTFGLILAVFFSACKQVEIKERKVFVAQSCPRLQTFSLLASCEKRNALMEQQINEYNLLFTQKENEHEKNNHNLR